MMKVHRNLAAMHLLNPFPDEQRILDGRHAKTIFAILVHSPYFVYAAKRSADELAG